MATSTALTGRQVRRSTPLSEAARTYVRRPTPWILGLLTLAAVAVRAVAGPVTWADAVVAVVPVLVFPFTEWVIHVVLLHWRPRRVLGLTLDPLVSRKHREHPRILNHRRSDIFVESKAAQRVQRTLPSLDGLPSLRG